MDIGPDFFLEVLSLRLYSSDEEAVSLCKAACELYEGEVSKNSTMNDEMSKLYMSILREINTNNIDLNNVAEVESLLLKFKHSPTVVKDPSILNAIKTIFNNRDRISSRRVNGLKENARKWIIWANNNINIKNMFRVHQKCASTLDPMEQELFLQEITDLSRKITEGYKDNVGPESVSLEHINMSCKSSIKEALGIHKEVRKKGAYQSGCQGVNNMLGTNQGLCRGESLVVGALSHNYKSGWLIDWARWLATITPPPSNVKRPCIVFTSLENEVYMNMMDWFKAAYINAKGHEPKGLSDDDIINIVTEMYSKNGIDLLVYRKLGSLFGPNEFIELHESIIAEGYTIIASILDYITLMRVPEGSGTDSKRIQQMCNTVVNYCKHKGITHITGAQLSADAAGLANEGYTDIVKRLNEKHLADCKGIKREYDIVVFMHIETNHMGFKYLTMRKDKHRHQPSAKEEDKYCAYRFTDTGIPDDINGRDLSVKNIYADDSQLTAEESSAGAVF